MGLAEYHRKRDFTRSAEPRGKTATTNGLLYVIQKHDASRLHYDFRLQLDGVLKSWAVPKGPSLDPRVRRLAVHVEDHPVEYGSFEGIIPAGEYGGGTVMLWDRGEWTPDGDAHESYRSGKLKFHLHGQKLKGGWMLVRKGGASAPADEKNWFLIKERDDEARSADEADILDESPLSVKTERDLNEIAGAQDRVWSSKSRVQQAEAATSVQPHGQRAKAAASKPEPESESAPRRTPASRPRKYLAGKKGSPLPDQFRPQLATLTKSAPSGDQWFNEIKLDGYRVICRIDEGTVEFISRNDLDWTTRLPHLVKAAHEFPVEQAILDGELVALLPDGVSSFQSLQNAFRDERQQALVYYVFDLLALNGEDLTKLSLEARKQTLQQLFTSKTSAAGPIRFMEHVIGRGPEFLKEACKKGLEGIICKRRDRHHQSGRGPDWLKVKCTHREEFVIGGFTKPSGARSGFGALLLGYHEGGELKYAGRVGTGFTERSLRDLHQSLVKLQSPDSPFSDLAGNSGQARGVSWVRPELVAQVEFASWTDDSILRHAAFLGLREDKPATEVVRESSKTLASVVKSVGTVKSTGTKSSKAKKTNMKKTPPAAEATSTEERPRLASKGSNNASLGTAPVAARDEFAGVRLTHPDKVLYPHDGFTKLDLANYYAQIVDWILPHMEGRPLVLVRCPEGEGHESFYQKHPGPGTPSHLRQVPVEEKSKTANYVMVEDVKGLVSLVQLSALEIHVWGSDYAHINRPDRLVFDLDPDPTVKWPQVIESAFQIRQFLQDLGLVSFVKTTGGKGLHIVVPIQRRTDWDDAKSFCHAVADAIVAGDPSRYTSNMAKAQRTGKIFIDYLRNQYAATAVAAYSTRARPGAPVSVPVEWDELTRGVRSDEFNIRNLPLRLSQLKRDPWKDISNVKQSITAAMKKTLASLLA